MGLIFGCSGHHYNGERQLQGIVKTNAKPVSLFENRDGNIVPFSLSGNYRSSLKLDVGEDTWIHPIHPKESSVYTHITDTKLSIVKQRYKVFCEHDGCNASQEETEVVGVVDADGNVVNDIDDLYNTDE
jgi:hypothetical protein